MKATHAARTWKSDGSTNVMLLAFAVENLRFNAVDAAVRRDAMIDPEGVADELRRGAVYETLHTTYRVATAQETPAPVSRGRGRPRKTVAP